MKSKLWPVFGVLAVAALWLASAYANYLAGLALADDDRMRYVIGAASVACDVMKGVALFLVIALVAKKHWVAAGVACAIFALCTMWSLRSAAYFMTDAMTGKVARIESTNKITDAKLKIIDLQQQRADFLAEQTVEVDVNNKFARKDALAANRDTSNEFKSLMAEVKEGVAELEKKTFLRATVDPIADVTGISPDKVVLASSMFFAVLLEMCSSWGFWLIARARDHAPALAILPEVSPPQEPAPRPEPVILVAQEPAQASPAPRRPKPKPEPVIEEMQEPAPKDTILNADEERIVRALRTLLVADTDNRILLASLGVYVNDLLPPTKKLKNRWQITNGIGPVIHRAVPGASKARIAGQVWITGVRLKNEPDSATLVGSQA